MNPKSIIQQIADETARQVREGRYQFAKQKAIEVAQLTGQMDFVETLDVCLQAAIEGDEITVGRAVEMFERAGHLCARLGQVNA